MLKLRVVPHKTCIKCGATKPESQFYRYANRKKRMCYGNICRMCKAVYVHGHYENNRQSYLDRSKSQKGTDEYKQYMRDYYRANKDALTEKAKEYASNHPHVRKKCRDNYRSTAEGKRREEVRKLVSLSIKYGVLVRPDICSICGEECYPEAHHSDYSKPLDVDWLCKRCHENIHHLNGGDV